MFCCVVQTNGWTALFYAAKVGHLPSVRLLLEVGADPAHKDKVRVHTGWGVRELWNLLLSLSPTHSLSACMYMYITTLCMCLYYCLNKLYTGREDSI